MTERRRGAARLTPVIFATVVLALGLAACGGDDEAGANGSNSELTEIRVAAQPFADSVGVYIGVQEGYFEDEGLDVEVTKLEAGDQIVNAVAGGSVEVGMSGTVPQLSAMAQGVPVEILAGVTRARGSGQANGHALLVKEDSPIESADDLVGKRIAANIIGSVVWLTSNAWLEQNGIDPSQVEYAEIPFPQMGDALTQGQVDAILALEPFTTNLQKQGEARRIAYPYREVFPEGFPVETAIASTDWLDDNPDAAEAFVRGLDRALRMQEEDEDRFRDYVAEYTGLDPAVTAEINLTESGTGVDVAGLQGTVDLLREYGVIEEEFEVSENVAQDATTLEQ